ncbi:MAG: hypothetical protein ACLVCI_08000 [Varibaculum timonense]
MAAAVGVFPHPWQFSAKIGVFSNIVWAAKSLNPPVIAIKISSVANCF